MPAVFHPPHLGRRCILLSFCRDVSLLLGVRRHTRGRLLRPLRNLHPFRKEHGLPRLVAANPGLNLGRRLPSVYPTRGLYCLDSCHAAARFLCQQLEHHVALNCRNGPGCLRVAFRRLAIDFQQDIPLDQD